MKVHLFKVSVVVVTRLIASIVFAVMLSAYVALPNRAHANTLGPVHRNISGDTCLYISEKYAQLSGLLGLPISPENVAPDGVGHYRHYQRGSIY